MRAENLNVEHQYDLDNFARIIREANDKLTAKKLANLGILVNNNSENEQDDSVSSSLRPKAIHCRDGKSEKNVKYVRNYFKQKLRKTLGL